MKLLLIFCFSLFSFVEADSVPQEKKDTIVVVARPEAKDVLVALIDGKPYLVEASDIQLLEEFMASVGVRGKNSDEFKKIKNLYPEQTKNVSGVFVIKMKEGATLPDKFTKKNRD
mgnify:CR=1 FL=1